MKIKLQKDSDANKDADVKLEKKKLKKEKKQEKKRLREEKRQKKKEAKQKAAEDKKSKKRGSKAIKQLEKNVSRDRKTGSGGYSWKAFFPFTEEGKSLRKEKQAKKKTTKREKFSFEHFMKKAGFEFVDEFKVKKTIFGWTVALSLIASFFIITSAARANKNFTDLAVFLAGYWSAIFVLTLILVAFAFVIFLDLKAYQRKKQIEAVLPDYLQLTSANISAGMPIDRALWFAVRPNFGILAKEIEEVAKSTYTGKDLREALEEFGEKYDSDVLNRSISLLLEGIGAGGEMAELLNKISLNIEETEIMRKEMAANVTTYAIFIGAATILGAPFLFALSTQLVVVMKTITQGLGDTGSGAAAGMFSFSINSNVVGTGDFMIYSIALLLFSSFFSGAIISVIKKGNVKEGFVTIPLFMVVTVSLYLMFNYLLGTLMGAFI